MVIWKLCEKSLSAKVWNDFLLNHADFSIYQSFEWGLQKSLIGQNTVRFFAIDENQKIVMSLQGFLKKLPLGVNVLWCPGGITGDLSRLKASWVKEIAKLLNLNVLLIRCAFHLKNDESLVDLLKNSSGSKSQKVISGPLSMSFYPNKSLEEIKSNMGQSWRHNLKRSVKHNLKIERWENPDIAQVVGLYREMEELKGISEQYSTVEIESILKNMKPLLIVFKATSESGELLGIRACTVMGNLAWDFLAALSENGRKKYVSFALFWEVAEYCHHLGIQHYNFMGIDPVKNPGVFNFKKGAGGEVLEYLGEWDWSTVPLLNLTFNTILKYKMIG